MNTPVITAFEKILVDHYDHQGRHDLPWRLPAADGSFDPYKILVSELMLQQTQVNRVIPKYGQFLKAFPRIEDLAEASLGEVLVLWNGLGYNRRAKFLHQAAQKVVSGFGGQIPTALEDLVSLPGVGKNTAGAIAAYAFNQPVVFIETNVRTVFIHHFFHDQTTVSDAEIKEILATIMAGIKSGEANNFLLSPREFYWALMDYGTSLKQTVGNLNVRSTSYVRQSPLEGSRRQIRGKVIRLLTTRGYTVFELKTVIADKRLESVLEDLVQEKLIVKTDTIYHLA